jgi:thiol-disulfide isomerase/thioredoxin
MKQLFSLLAAATISLGAFAQLPNGSIAPDFTATDINGVEHNLYTYLDSGYSVILDFSATWCGPCWAYHQAGTLETIHETYGLEGSNEVRVFYLEADDTTTDADLNGTGTNTAGDWVTGTQYAIIDNAGSIFDDYNGAYYPTIYTVCPNRILTESGQVDVNAHASIFQEATCQPASENNDPSLINYTGDVLSCGGAPVTLSVSLMNNGLETLTACTITAYDGATAVGSVDWTGSLETYDFEDVVVTTTSVTTDTNFSIEVTSADENGANNEVAAGVITAVESTNNVRLTLLTDAYPGETTWALLDESFAVVAQGGPYSTPGDEVIVDWQLDLGCYTFLIEDAFGDGLHASWYSGSGPDGSFSLDAMDGSAVSSTLLSSYAPDEFAVLVMPFEVTSVSDVEEEVTLASTVTMFPNPTQGLSNIQFTTGVAAKTSFEVTNLLGERVMMEDFGTLSAGTHRMELNLEGFDAGLYLVNFTAGGETTTLRVTKQ